MTKNIILPYLELKNHFVIPLPMAIIDIISIDRQIDLEGVQKSKSKTSTYDW